MFWVLIDQVLETLNTNFVLSVHSLRYIEISSLYSMQFEFNEIININLSFSFTDYYNNHKIALDQDEQGKLPNFKVESGR